MKLHFALLQGCRSVLRGASVHCGITVGCGYGCNQANFCPHPSVMLGAEDNSCETFNQRHTAFLLLYNNKLLSASVFNVALTQVVVHAPGKQDKLQLQIIISFQAYVYDIRSSRYLHKLQKHSDTVLSVTFNPATPQVRPCCF